MGFVTLQALRQAICGHSGEKFKRIAGGDLVRSEYEVAQSSLLPNVNASCDLLNLGPCSCYVPLHIVRKLAGEIIVDTGVFSQDFPDLKKGVQ